MDAVYLFHRQVKNILGMRQGAALAQITPHSAEQVSRYAVSPGARKSGVLAVFHRLSRMLQGPPIDPPPQTREFLADLGLGPAPQQTLTLFVGL